MQSVLGIRFQVSGVRGQRTEVRGQMTEVRGQRSEVRGQRSEVRGQKTEFGSGNLEVGSRTRRRPIGRDYAAAEDAEGGVKRRRKREKSDIRYSKPTQPPAKKWPVLSKKKL
jgi:hypothetical protein